MSEPFFRPAKKRVGIYFNTGKMRYAVQHDEPGKPVDPKLLAAVESALRVFFREWNEFDLPVSKPPKP